MVLLRPKLEHSMIVELLLQKQVVGTENENLERNGNLENTEKNEKQKNTEKNGKQKNTEKNTERNGNLESVKY